MSFGATGACGAIVVGGVAAGGATVVGAVAAADGAPVVGVVAGGITIGGTEGILGKAIIIHENADDFKTQPTGNAGGRVACGVIEALK